MAVQDLYSVEQVASQLGLHVRTVRNYVRDGRLKGIRIGKQYRIAREDLESLTGHRAAPAHTAAAPRRELEVSSTVGCQDLGCAPGTRIANSVWAATNGRSATDGPLRIDTIY